MNRTTTKMVLKFGWFLLAVVLIQNFNCKTTLLAADISENLEFSVPNTPDGRIYQKIIQDTYQHNLQEASLSGVIQTVAEQFLGAEYQAGLLDRLPQETLYVSLQKFDCLLFVETVLAIANNIVTQNFNYQSFTSELENYRYWNGIINGYCSRLHYFSDWIDNNQQRGNVANITPELGGINTVKKLNFMTTNRDLYPNLTTDNINFKCISQVEASLSPAFNYIPTKNINHVYDQLRPGDIIGVATNIPGLDFTHTGFVYLQPNGHIGLIHASPAGKVVIAKDLQNYVENVKNARGIVVTRVNEPKLH
ncbi:MAG: N-acetylmuramoyl-L-alanine amidase-like domain-containing protein [Cyanobacteria bacterium P01_G01_bin.67]